MNSVGWSGMSKEIDVVEMPQVQAPSAPTLLNFDQAMPEETRVSSFSFSLMWSAPMHTGGTDVTHYEIAYWVREEEQSSMRGGKGVVKWASVQKHVIVPHNKKSWIQRKTILNLLGGTRYWDISVLSINAEGFKSEPSNKIECTTTEPTRIQLLQVSRDTQLRSIMSVELYVLILVNSLERTDAGAESHSGDDRYAPEGL